MKDVMDKITSLLTSNNVDANLESNDDWTFIVTDTVFIYEMHASGLPSPNISFICEQEKIRITISSDDIDDVDVVVDEEERPRLYVATRLGHYFEFALIKEDKNEGTE